MAREFWLVAMAVGEVERKQQAGNLLITNSLRTLLAYYNTRGTHPSS
jgi:hypothetical protein